MIRDIIANQVPMIFRENIYALPCIIGGILYVYLQSEISHKLSNKVFKSPKWLACLSLLIDRFLMYCYITWVILLYSVFNGLACRASTLVSRDNYYILSNLSLPVKNLMSLFQSFFIFVRQSLWLSSS